jgi:hypothetical protein
MSKDPDNRAFKLGEVARYSKLKPKEKNDMAKHEVRNPSHPIEAIPADQLDNLRKMPVPPGLQIHPEVPNTRKSSSVSVSGAPKDDGGCPPAPAVEAASRYVPPPARVTASNTKLEPSGGE